MSSSDARPTLVAPDDDPHLWLEALDDDRVISWIDAQNAQTEATLIDGQFRTQKASVLAHMDRPDKTAYIRRYGGLLYNYWQDAKHPRGQWRRTTMESYRSGAPEWDVLLDLDALATAEHKDWVWKGPARGPSGQDRIMLKLSPGGSDAAVWREFDLGTRRFVDDGFALPVAKSDVSWWDENTLLVASALGEGMETLSGYARTVRLWQRGTDFSQAKVVFETDASNMIAFCYVDRVDGQRVFYMDKPNFIDRRVWIGDQDGPQQRLDIPADARFDLERGWLVVAPRQDWALDETMVPADTVVAFRWEAFAAGDRTFQTLFEPTDTRVLVNFGRSGPFFSVGILDNVTPQFELWVEEDGAFVRAPARSLPKAGSVGLYPLDGEAEEMNGDMVAAYNTPTDPPTVEFLPLRGPSTILSRAPEGFDAQGLVVERFDAPSSDGTLVPYFQVSRPDPGPHAPVLMTGYGGFQISNLPVYRAATGKLWLEPGGVFVETCIRGGGEFGSAWHEAGRRKDKARSHDDFAAVAAHLVERGVTIPGRIAAMGGSNGGLLIANMLTRYPERFGALLCQVPLIDMRRYTKLLAGHSWIAEYGDPDGADWDFLGPMSAYHVAQEGKNYPPILLATTSKDDRVHPGHARKMAAKLQAMGYNAQYFESKTGGHGAGKDNAEVAHFTTLGLRFLQNAIGWEI